MDDKLRISSMRPLKPRDLQVVVFDLDDTLYLEREYVHSGFRHIARLVAPSAGVAAGEIFRFVNMTVEKWHTRGRNLDLLLKQYPVLKRTWTIEMLVQEYRKHQPRIRYMHGMESLLQDLSNAGARLGIITDGPSDSQNRKLEALRLTAKVDKAIVTEDYGPDYHKPRPRSFGLIMSQFHGRPESCVYIGDNPSKDFLAPRALGWKTVRLRVRGQLHELAEPLSQDAAAHVDCRTVRDLRMVLLDRLAIQPIAAYAQEEDDHEHNPT